VTGLNIEFHDDSVFVLIGDQQEPKEKHIQGLMASLQADGIAEKIDDVYVILDTAFTDLDPEDKALLDLPTGIPYQMKVVSKNTPSDPDFQCNLELFTESGVCIPYAGQRQGCVIDIEDRRYLLSSSQLKFMKAIDELAETAGNRFVSRTDRKAHVLDRIGDMQESAESAGIQIGSYLKSFSVVRPEKIEPGLSFNDDGSIDLHPIASGISLSDSEAVEYSRKSLRGRKGRKSVSVGPDDHSIEILHSDEYREGLMEIRDKQHFEKEEVADFLENPTSYFANPDLFELEGFSERVIGLAEIAIEQQVQQRRKSQMNIDWNSMTFFPDSTIGEISPEDLEINTVEDLDSLEMAFDRAQNLNKKIIVFKGAIFKCEPEDMEEFIRVKKDLLIVQGLLGGELDEALARLRLNQKISEKTYLGLAIHENIEDLHVETSVLEEVEFKLPHSLRTNLYDFQKTGLMWLQQRSASPERAGLLADDMGLGKTLQLLSFVAAEMESGEAGPYLVIVPVTLLENWRKEFSNHFAPEISGNILVMHREFINSHRDKGISIRQRGGLLKHFPHKKKISRAGLNIIRNSGLVITNYETIRDYQISLGEISFAAVICDEIQKAKNPSTQLTKAIKAMNAEFRVASTATPVENSLQDLWSIMDFISPGFLGTLKDFKERFVPIDKTRVSDKEINYLRQRIDGRKLILRRTKSDTLDLPEKKFYSFTVPMSLQQKELYSQAVQIKVYDRTQILGVLQNMIKICSHPFLAKPGIFQQKTVTDFVSSCPKLGWTLDKLEVISQLNERVIVFSHFKKMLRILFESIQDRFGISAPIISGDTSIPSRQGIVDKFNNTPGFSVMLLSPLAAGVGLNITGANHVIHYTRLWNPAKEDQATDRVYRIGQSKDVSVYYPIVQEPDFGKTIEEHIDALLGLKRDVAASFLVPSDDRDIRDALVNKLFKKELN
jgi:SNF2 family DNA or RNA helicase